MVVNLKDKKNPGLRESVVSGDLPAAKLAKMTSQDMASEERKNADKKIKEENMFKALGAEEQQAETDAFQCGRCKQVSGDFWFAGDGSVLGADGCDAEKMSLPPGADEKC